jgi:formate hydrogenlyase transcriptional activator
MLSAGRPRISRPYHPSVATQQDRILKKPSVTLIPASSAKARYLSRFKIGLRLSACFFLIIFVMLVGNALLIWQFFQVRTQVDHLASVDQELIVVLQFQANFRSFYSNLNDIAQSKDKSRLLAESQDLQNTIADDAGLTQSLFRNLPPGSNLSSEILAAVEAVQSSLPSNLAAVLALANSDDWPAVRLRLTKQILPLESLSDNLVKDIDHDVASEREAAIRRIALAQRRMNFIFLITGSCSLLIAGALGAGITQSISEPFHRLRDASQALGQGNFNFQIAITGNDELSQLGTVFNSMVGKLGGLYEDLRSREARLWENEKELQELIEFAPMHVFVVRPDGTSLYANRAVLDYHGWTLEQWTSQGFDSGVLHSEDRKGYVANLNSGFAGSAPFEAEARIIRKDGTYRWFLSRFNPMQDEQGQILRWYVAQTDIEESKQETHRAQSENLALREEVNKSSAFLEILGSSDNVLRVLSEIARVATTDSTVLILGETGTGKELVARAIHYQSHRASRAFIRVNCASIPSSLVSSELFGHEKGAFTGAVQQRLGRFEAASGGTIFLDEIGELPLETQVAMLRVLQEREFERVGSNKSISVDVRILAATNRDLRKAVLAGTFREDLFYRLNVFPIQLPPLRERPDDIPLLVEYFIARYSAKSAKKILHIKRSALDLFRRYEWPGNIRELQNVVERAVLLCDGDTLSVDETWFKHHIGTQTNQASIALKSLKRVDSSRERLLIESALADSAGKISGPSGAAAKLGIPRQTLESKIARLGIDKRKYLPS